MKNLKLMGHQLTRHEMRTVNGGNRFDDLGGYCSFGDGTNHTVTSCLSNECDHMCTGEGWICSGS